MFTSSLLRQGCVDRGSRRTRNGPSPLLSTRRIRSLAFECLEQRSLLAGDVSSITTADVLPTDSTAAIVDVAKRRVGFTMELTRPDGSPLSSLSVGEEFVLRVLVQDLRKSPLGVFAAYVDVEWDPTKAVSTGVVDYGDAYFNGRHASITTPGLIDETGAFAYLEPVGGQPLELFKATLRAVAPGPIKFQANPADVNDLRDVIVYARDGERALVSDDATVFGRISIEVTEAPSVTDESGESEASGESPAATAQLPYAGFPLDGDEVSTSLQVEAIVAETDLASDIAAIDAQSTNTFAASTDDDAAIETIQLLGASATLSATAPLGTFGGPMVKTILAIDQAPPSSNSLDLSTTLTGAGSTTAASNPSADSEDEDETIVIDAALDGDDLPG